MADSNNPGQFGNRDDTQAAASAGGQASSGSFGDSNSADPSAAGKKGAQMQPREAKVRGGQNSHRGDGNS
ncbi:MAG TPA: hypothetical protein VG964_02860 [Candidatus Saccharimonadales bacterium]|nr:hypothetical protein [Candidatus Saccharimonadales bacterium]